MCTGDNSYLKMGWQRNIKFLSSCLILGWLRRTTASNGIAKASVASQFNCFLCSITTAILSYRHYSCRYSPVDLLHTNLHLWICPGEPDGRYSSVTTTTRKSREHGQLPRGKKYWKGMLIFTFLMFLKKLYWGTIHMKKLHPF